MELIAKGEDTALHETPILFVHGAWHGAWCWDRGFLDDFAAQGFKAFAFDLRGHGADRSDGQLSMSSKEYGSDRSGDRWFGWNGQDYVEDLRAAVEEITARTGRCPVVVGHSMGGYVVQKYLEKHGDKVAAAVFMASIPDDGAWRTTLGVAWRYPLTFLKLNLTISLQPLIADFKRAKQLLFSPDMREKKAETYWSQLVPESYRVFLDMLVLDRPRARRFPKIPYLVLGAEYDAIVSRSGTEHLAKACSVEPIMFPMGHDMMLEKGKKKCKKNITDIIGDFVRSVDDGTAIPRSARLQQREVVVSQLAL